MAEDIEAELLEISDIDWKAQLRFVLKHGGHLLNDWERSFTISMRQLGDSQPTERQVAKMFNLFRQVTAQLD